MGKGDEPRKTTVNPVRNESKIVAEVITQLAVRNSSREWEGDS